jgi:hypothetical protein
MNSQIIRYIVQQQFNSHPSLLDLFGFKYFIISIFTQRPEFRIICYVVFFYSSFSFSEIVTHHLQIMVQSKNNRLVQSQIRVLVTRCETLPRKIKNCIRPSIPIH